MQNNIFIWSIPSVVANLVICRLSAKKYGCISDRVVFVIHRYIAFTMFDIIGNNVACRVAILPLVNTQISKSLLRATYDVHYCVKVVMVSQSYHRLRDI